MKDIADPRFGGMAAALAVAFAGDPLTSVIGVTLFKKGDTLVISEPASPWTPMAPRDLCLVKLNVGPGNPGPAGAPSTSPGIGIEIWLPAPDEWDERIHAIGGLGGYDGGLHGSPDAVGWFYAALTAGGEGTVSASTNSGHAITNGSWAIDADGTPARQLWEDYSHRALHEMAVRTKALTAAFYGRPAKYSYYEGASNGGRHGYRIAQQYPEDFDGIIALLPAINYAEFVLGAILWRDLVIERDLGGVRLTEGQMDLVSNAAIKACDLVGGVHMGYIVDHEACRYDPTRDPEVLCVADGGANTSDDAVTLAQARAIAKIWYGQTSDGSVPDPAKDNGATTALGGKRLWYGFARGTSLYNAFFTKSDPRMRELLKAAQESGDSLGADFVAIAWQNPTMAGRGFHNPTGDGQGLWRGLSYEQAANLFSRAIALDPVFAHLSSDNPDLSAFKARGGKFLSWHGWNDEAIPIQGTMRYYDRVIETMGGAEAVQDFFRLFLIPGGGHMSPQGSSNPEANPPIPAPGQFYQLLRDWVENGNAPDRVELRSPSPHPVENSAPVYPYPQRTVYLGGDPRQSASYGRGA